MKKSKWCKTSFDEYINIFFLLQRAIVQNIFPNVYVPTWQTEHVQILPNYIKIV